MEMLNVTQAAALCSTWGVRWIEYCAARGYDFAPCSNGRTSFAKADIIHFIVWEN
jgi:hypothetical protein